MSAAFTSQTFRARAPSSIAEAVAAIRDSILAALLPGAAGADEGQGLRVMVNSDHLVRWYAVPSEGVLLIECSSRDRSADFEVFVVPHEDGDLRAGWRRRWAPDGEPPGAWMSISEFLTIEGLCHPRVDPDFAVLLTALAGGSAPVIQYEDCDARASLAADIRHLREVIERQAGQLRKLQFAASAARGVESPSTEIPAPAARQWSMADIAEWADLHADTITILPRAIAEAKKSDLENAQLAFDALDLLAHTYRLVKLSHLPREDYKAHADRLGLFIGGSVSAPGEHGDAYFVQYGGRRRLLDQHLGRGTSRDSRYSLRVYFFWDEDTQRAVVGWLPSHLPNSLT